jgi:hypothetical protein
VAVQDRDIIGDLELIDVIEPDGSSAQRPIEGPGVLWPVECRHGPSLSGTFRWRKDYFGHTDLVGGSRNPWDSTDRLRHEWILTVDLTAPSGRRSGHLLDV